MDFQDINDKLNAFLNNIINFIKGAVVKFNQLGADEQAAWAVMLLGIVIFLAGLILW